MGPAWKKVRHGTVRQSFNRVLLPPYQVSLINTKMHAGTSGTYHALSHLETGWTQNEPAPNALVEMHNDRWETYCWFGGTAMVTAKLFGRGLDALAIRWP